MPGQTEEKPPINQLGAIEALSSIKIDEAPPQGVTEVKGQNEVVPATPPNNIIEAAQQAAVDLDSEMPPASSTHQKNASGVFMSNNYIAENYRRNLPNLIGRLIKQLNNKVYRLSKISDPVIKSASIKQLVNGTSLIPSFIDGVNSVSELFKFFNSLRILQDVKRVRFSKFNDLDSFCFIFAVPDEYKAYGDQMEVGDYIKAGHSVKNLETTVMPLYNKIAHQVMVHCAPNIIEPVLNKSISITCDHLHGLTWKPGYFLRAMHPADFSHVIQLGSIEQMDR